MGVIWYNGVASTEFDIEVEYPPGYEAAERDYENISIPGRNGDLIIDRGGYKNVPRSYVVSIGSIHKPYVSLANRLIQWLSISSGYLRLEDTYEPDYFRLASYKEPRNIANIYNSAARATITFDCKPPRFLKSGNTPVVISGSGTKIKNPTQFYALPLITIYGSGEATVGIGGYTITLSNLSEHITIDCDLQDAYKGTVNKNNDITLSNNVFPKLLSGETNITFSSGVSSIAITPRWWTL